MRDYASPLARTLGERYALEGELGRGGTAIVYRARDLRLGRSVAIKVFDPQLVGSLGADRFLREIALEAQLNHPLIVPLLDSGEVEGTPYFIMPCVEGETLRDRLDRERELPIDDAVQIARDVAVALQYAHERGIVHRDIKPENILLSAGTAVVADFGIARALTEAGASGRLTQTGVTLGTVPYMSPEQAVADASIDARSDIYSLGCTLFEMLVGESPHTGPTAQAVIAKRLSESPRSVRQLRTTVAPALDRVVQRALAVSPADRFATAKDFVDALARARTGETELSTLDLPARSPTPGEPAGVPRHAAVPPVRRRWFVPSLVAAALIVLAAAGYFWRTRIATARVGPVNSMAVLPFTDISERQDQAFFALGMAEELIRALTPLPGLRVTGRTSSFAFRDTREDISTIARRLDVRALLTGSVRRAGDSLRISAELVQADGQSLWSRTYDRTLRDVFAVQEEIARAIATELSVELRPRQALIAPSTKDVGAYQLYLRARLAWAQRTPQSLRQAEEFYRQAVVLDPSFARAWGGLADCYIAIARNFFGRPIEYLPLAREAALRAVALDSNSAEAHTARAAVAYYVEHEWELADHEFRRAIALDSTYADAHYFYSLFLATRQMGDSALAAARRAFAMEPLSGPASMGPGMAMYLTNRPAEAVPLLRTAVDANPRFYFPYIWLGLSLAMTGDSLGGIAAADQAVRLAPDNRLMEVMRGQVLAIAGRRDSARAVARRASIDANRAIIATFELARLYAFLGERQEALDWIGRSIEARETQATQLLTPGFSALHNEPRFRSYLQTLHQDLPLR